ncbi:MAG: hypothetical protein JSU92_13610 [Deltaproteobacteria bacterium]|nr:MAG: hypothetical protein JSU92_13610 [Deltaproteobacteria bacterium]
MDSKERIEAVVALEAPDRVPVGPLLDHWAATYSGITKQEFMENGGKRIAAILKTMREVGPWDIAYMAETANPVLLMGAPARVHWPGRDLPPDEIHQFEEFELLKPDDYDLLLKDGLNRFLRRVAHRLYPDTGTLKGIGMIVSFAWELRRHAKMVKAAGTEVNCGFMIPGPLFEYFSIGRSMARMCTDLYDYPEKIKAASREWAKSLTSMAIRFARLMGVPRVFIGLARSSPAMISPRHFEEFVMPELEYMVNNIVDAGMFPVFHCDTDWTRNLPLFRRFPAKRCIIELDGASDIFKAKEILGDWMCIKGDVPAHLLAFREKDRVMDYCRRLIQEVGKGGGFILSSGCSIPANAKAENVRALVEAAEEWGYY